MRYLGTALAYVVALTLVSIVMTFVVFYLVGTHCGLLPSGFYFPVLGLGWAAVIVVPVLFAKWMWRRLGVLR